MSDWKSLQRHKLSAERKDIIGPAWYQFCLRMKRFGFRKENPIYLHEQQVLVGWQRFRACLETGTEPIFEPKPDDISAEDFVELMEDVRRHESTEDRDARRQRVAERVAAGASIRSIAEDEGVDPKTIDNDVKKSGGEGSPPEKVVGKDGKKQAAKKAQVLCRHCEHRVIMKRPVIDDCPDCAELRKILKPKKVKAEPVEKPAPERSEDALKDDAGVVVPIRLIPVFEAKADYQAAMKLLNACSKAFKVIEDGPTKDAKSLNPNEHYRKFYKTFKSARARVAAMEPSLVCSACQGEACEKCTDGWVSKERAEAKS